MSATHRLNTEFSWLDRPTRDLQICTLDQIQQFNRDGFFVLKQAVAGGKLRSLRSEIDPLELAGGGSTLISEQGELASYDADELTFTCNLVAKNEVVKAFYRSRLFQKITHDLIGPAARLYWDQAVYKHPQKGGEFPWHQDNGYTYVRPQAYLTCWLALSDALVAAGCPWVIPGAHKAGTYAHAREPYGLEIEGVGELIQKYGEVAAPAKAGDMVIFSSLTPHKTGPNLTQNIRKALIIQFIPDGAVRMDAGGEVRLGDPVLNQPVPVQG